MPEFFTGLLSDVLPPPEVKPAGLEGLRRWRSFGNDGAEYVELGGSEQRFVGLLRCGETEAFCEGLCPNSDETFSGAVVLQGNAECDGAETLKPWDFLVLRPAERFNTLLHPNSLLLTFRTGERRKAMDGAPVTVDLLQFLTLPDLTTLNDREFQPVNNGLPGETLFREARKTIFAGLYREPRTHQPYPIRFGEGGGFGLVLSGVHSDGKSRQPAGSVNVFGPRDSIKSQNLDPCVLLSIFLGETE